MTSRSLRIGATAGIALSVALALCTTAAHAEWSRPAEVATGPSVYSPLITEGPLGETVAGWVQGPDWMLTARPVGMNGKLGQPARLTKASTGDYGPWLLGTRAGFVAIWLEGRSEGYSVRARRIKANGKRGPARTLVSAEDGSQHAGFAVADAAIDRQGNAIVAWSRVRGHDVLPKGYEIESATVHARRFAADGKLGPVLDLSSDEEHAFAPALAVAPSGRATIAWNAGSPAGSGSTVRAATLMPSGRLGSTHVLSAEEPDDLSGVRLWMGGRGAPRVAINLEGAATVAWDSSASPGIAARHIGAGGHLGPSSLVASRDASACCPDPSGLVMDESGAATVGWRSAGRNWIRRVAPNGNLGSQLALSAPSEDTSSATLAIDRDGTITAAWGQVTSPGSPPSTAIQIRRISSSRKSGPLHTAARTSSRFGFGQPVVFGGTSGNTAVAWRRYRPSRIEMVRWTPR